jgi:hypothetical protein
MLSRTDERGLLGQLDLDADTCFWLGETARFLQAWADTVPNGAAGPGVVVPVELLHRVLAEHGCRLVPVVVAGALTPADDGREMFCVWCELAMLLRDHRVEDRA